MPLVRRVSWLAVEGWRPSGPLLGEMLPQAPKCTACCSLLNPSHTGALLLL